MAANPAERPCFADIVEILQPVNGAFLCIQQLLGCCILWGSCSLASDDQILHVVDAHSACSLLACLHFAGSWQKAPACAV